MRLTEAKLKQMILEALNKKYDGRPFFDSGILTPDEKLRAKIGDKYFNKIQGLDPNQAEIMKQSFDPDYPSTVNPSKGRGEDFLKELGYELDFSKNDRVYDREGKKHLPQKQKGYHLQRSNGERFGFELTYAFYEHENSRTGYNYLQYFVRIFDSQEMPMVGERFMKTIKVPNVFEIDLETEEGDELAFNLIIEKEKPSILTQYGSRYR